MLKALYDRAMLREELASYVPYNEQEALDKQVMLAALDADSNCFNRSAQAHFTCSAWVVDPQRTQTIMVFHNIYHSWSWIGGHADGCCDLRAVALRELGEETGVTQARSEGSIFSLEVLTVDGHEKHGVYVSSHLHLNVTYLFEVDPGEPLRIKPDENSGVKWVPFKEVIALSDEPWIRERIYAKLLAKSGFKS